MKKIVNKIKKVPTILNKKKQLFCGIFAQIATSAATFIFTAILIKNMENEEFGVFSITFSVAFFIGGAVSAITATQMAVHAGEIQPSLKPHFISYMLWEHNKICAITTGSIILVTYLLDKIFAELNLISKVAACCLTAFAYSYKDFILKIFYEEKKEDSLLILNSISSLLLIFGTILQHTLKLKINTEISLILYSISTILPTAYWQILMKIRSFKNRKNKIKPISWKNSFHNLTAHTLSNLRSQGYLYISGLILGSPAVAALNAARMLAMPAFVIVPAITQRILPLLSKSIKLENRREALEIKNNALKFIFTIGTLSSIIILLIYPFIEDALYSKYENNLTYAIIWLIIAITSGARAVFETALVADRKFSTQSRLNFNSLLLLIILTTILSLLIGPLGALISLFFSELFFIIQITIFSPPEKK